MPEPIQFLPSHLDSLRAQFPKADVHAIAARIERESATRDFANPDAYLKSACRNEQERADKPEPAPGEKSQWRGFYKDGSAAFGESTVDRGLTGFAERLVATRRGQPHPPAYFAQIIGASQFADSFNPKAMEQWARFDKHRHWRNAYAARSVEQFVIDAGHGSQWSEAWEKTRTFRDAPSEAEYEDAVRSLANWGIE